MEFRAEVGREKAKGGMAQVELRKRLLADKHISDAQVELFFSKYINHAAQAKEEEGEDSDYDVFEEAEEMEEDRSKHKGRTAVIRDSVRQDITVDAATPVRKLDELAAALEKREKESAAREATLQAELSEMKQLLQTLTAKS